MVDPGRVKGLMRTGRAIGTTITYILQKTFECCPMFPLLNYYCSNYCSNYSVIIQHVSRIIQLFFLSLSYLISLVLETKCECEAPFSGTFCDELSTGHVYGYYNRRVYWLGPLGALTLIPMCILYVGCEYMAKKRRVKRVCEMLDGQNINVTEEVLQRLLAGKVLEV
uniref:EGF-like domain-containing protein n=1 Tax=Angiostrongylus cantonensis TaxID=6313 RepID=C7BVR1_ANGCA|nr:hypothetical protein [Angiostrongylus cantonensis]